MHPWNIRGREVRDGKIWENHDSRLRSDVSAQFMTPTASAGGLDYLKNKLKDRATRLFFADRSASNTSFDVHLEMNFLLLFVTLAIRLSIDTAHCSPIPASEAHLQNAASARNALQRLLDFFQHDASSINVNGLFC